MELTDRVVRIVHVPGAGLLAADVTGRVHLLDGRLRLLRSSQGPTGHIFAGHAPLYTVTAAGGWVVGKDKRGTLLRWRLDTLELVDVLDAEQTCDRGSLMEDEEPSPVLSRGIIAHEGKVYVNNGYRQIVVLDLETFTVERIVPSFAGDVAVEWFCTEHPEVDVVSDKAGRVFFGRLDALDFPTAVTIDGGNVHRICYDRVHRRFWATQDDGVDENDQIANGVLVLDAEGTVREQILLAKDDVEFLALSPDHRTVYVGGFDGVLHILDNAETPRVTASVTGFSHQLTDLAIADDGTLFTLTQDGEIRKLTRDGRTVLARAPFRRQCVWDIQPSVDDPDELYIATDDGVTVVSVTADGRGAPQVLVRDHLRTGLGFTRRVVPLPGGWAGNTRDQWIVRADRGGNVLWRRRLDSLVHTVSGSADHRRLLACTNDGAFELSTATGELLGQLDIGDASAWAGCYLPDGERVVGASNGMIRVFAADSPELLWKVDTEEYPKRIWPQDGSLIVTGGDGIKAVSLSERRITHRWSELLDNTAENAVLLPDTVFAVCYGSQMGVYERDSTEILGLVEDLPDFPKGMAAVPYGEGSRALLVGGRGGYLGVYRLPEEGGPDKAPLTKVRDLILPRQGRPAPAATEVG